MAPKDENELRQMLGTAIAMDGPVVLRYPRGCGLGVPIEADFSGIPIGKAEQIRSGGKIAFLGIGSMVDACAKASDLLRVAGIESTIINARFVKPLDHMLLEELAVQMDVIVTVEDNVLAGGFGSAVLELLNEHQLNDVKVLRFGLPDHFVEQGSRTELLEKYNLTGETIAAMVRNFIR
jgi:1-deoxy-D-xylulose-5-phosphate synthase